MEVNWMAMVHYIMMVMVLLVQLLKICMDDEMKKLPDGHMFHSITYGKGQWEAMHHS